MFVWPDLEAIGPVQTRMVLIVKKPLWGPPGAHMLPLLEHASKMVSGDLQLGSRERSSIHVGSLNSLNER